MAQEALGNIYVAGESDAPNYFNIGSTATDSVVIKYNAVGADFWKINANLNHNFTGLT